MGFLARLLGMETRLQPDLGWWNWNLMRQGIVHASPDSVLSNLAVAARCVALRSELLASVPLFLFRRTANGGREKADDNALYGALHDIANPLQSAFEFREFLIRSLDLTGNAYARVERNQRGQVVALWPFNPSDVETSSHVTPQQAVEVMFDVQRAPTHIGQQTSRHRHLNTFRKRT